MPQVTDPVETRKTGDFLTIYDPETGQWFVLMTFRHILHS